MATELMPRMCICPRHPSPSRRDCYALRHYGIAGLGAPTREEDDGECECNCHEYDFDDDEAFDDEILVLNVGGYVGESTRSEIAYAEAHGKRVRWLETT